MACGRCLPEERILFDKRRQKYAVFGETGMIGECPVHAPTNLYLYVIYSCQLRACSALQAVVRLMLVSFSVIIVGLRRAFPRT